MCTLSLCLLLILLLETLCYLGFLPHTLYLYCFFAAVGISGRTFTHLTLVEVEVDPADVEIGGDCSIVEEEVLYVGGGCGEA